MTPERWREIERLYYAALQRDASQRTAFLDEACTDDATLRREVEALLQAHEQAGSFLAAPALEGGAPGINRTPAQSLVGQQLGSYKIISLLGAGGMGEVYLAQDTRLGRKIALKLLPPQFIQDPDRVRRFEREARAASALNHPNILTIHDIGQSDGRFFMATEFIDGQTLRQQMAGRRLKLAEILDVVIQVASALGAAHELRIVHRDIKPENIMLRRDGYIKVLDFGLAKLTEPEATSIGGRASAVATLNTETGVMMGTAHYMSPEQALGRQVDQRTDIFSLGVVLYEMAAGTRPFNGSTAAAVLDSLLHQTPRPLPHSNPDLPQELDRIISKALQKDREVRYQTASDLCADLKRLQRDTDSGRGPAVPGRVKPKWLPGAASRSWSLAWAAGITVLAVAFGLAWYIWEKTGHQLELRQHQLTSNPSETPVYKAAISPDGKYLAYADESGLQLKRIDTGERYSFSALVNSKILGLAWFPDGTKLLASAMAPSEKGPGLWTVSILGGPPHKLWDDAMAACVSPDGLNIAFISRMQQEIWLMSASGEEPRRIVRAGVGDNFADLTWFPSSQLLGYLRHHPREGRFGSSIDSCDLSGSQVSTIVSLDERLTSIWLTSSGRLLYSISDWERNEASLWAVHVDVRNGHTADKPRGILKWPGLGNVWLSASANGKRLGFLRETFQHDVYVGELEGNGARLRKPRRLTFDDRDDFPAAWTPDSKAVLFSSNRNGNFDIFKQALEKRIAEAIVVGPGDQCDPTVSADGTWLLYFDLVANRRLVSANPVSLRRVPIAGGPPQLVLNERGFYIVQCARAPSNLCVVDERQGKQLALYAFDPLRGKGPELIRVDLKAPIVEYNWDLSPDGSRIAFLSHGDGPNRILVLPLTGGVSHEIVVKGWDRLQAVHWAADGEGLFVSSQSEGSEALLFVDLKGQPHVLWQQASWGGWGIPSPDGRYLAFPATTTAGNAWMLEDF